MAKYYQTIEKTLNELRQGPCGVDYQINKTRNSLLKVISPIPQLQIAPYGSDKNISSLREDIAINLEGAQNSNFVILDSADQKTYLGKIPPDGFILYMHLEIPQGEYFMPHFQELLIYTPKDCIR